MVTRLFEGRVMVKMPSAKEKSGLIELPNDVDPETTIGTVILAGPGRTDPSDGNSRFPMRVSVGDNVLFGRNIEIQYVEDDVTYYIMHESNVIGITE